MNSLWLTENKNNSKFESLSKNIMYNRCGNFWNDLWLLFIKSWAKCFYYRKK